MPVYASNIIQNPLVGIKGEFQIASGTIILNLSGFQSSSSPNDWMRDYIFWQVDINTVKWGKKPIFAAILVFPLTFDASSSVDTNKLGWGIDSWGLDPDEPVTAGNKLGLKAQLVLKTKAAEVIRVGYQVTLSHSDGE
jgi:hypothetical protein